MRAAIFFYAGHSRRGLWLNHGGRHKSDAALLVVSGADLVSAVGPDTRIYHRRWDQSIALLGGYVGPTQRVLTDMSVAAIKRGSEAP